MAARKARISKEIAMLKKNPPPGAHTWQVDEDKLDHLEADVLGPSDSPYSGGVFKLEILLPEKYPYEPPKIRFQTKIYHPNIDEGGRICLDILKPLPQGAWKPVMNVSSCLTSLQVLMSEPNPDDPLMPEIAEQFQYQREKFNQTAAEWTKNYAIQESDNSAAKRIKLK